MRAVAAASLVIGTFGQVAGATPDAGFARVRPSAVDEARARLVAAETKLAEVEGRLAELEREREQIEREHLTLTERQRQLAAQLEESRRDVRQLAVSAYVSGGPAGNAGRLLEMSRISDSVWRAALIDGQTDLTVASARRYAELLQGADLAVRQLVGRVDQNSAKIEQASADRYLAATELKAAEQQLALASARAFSAAGVALSGSDPGGDAWARLRNCESSGNYAAVSPSGRYRGAYQFDLRTWASVGGEGDPIDASPAEQDLRARMLYARRGRSPWPVCGRFLP